MITARIVIENGTYDVVINNIVYMNHQYCIRKNGELFPIKEIVWPGSFQKVKDLKKDHIKNIIKNFFNMTNSLKDMPYKWYGGFSYLEWIQILSCELITNEQLKKVSDKIKKVKEKITSLSETYNLEICKQIEELRKLETLMDALKS